MPIRTPQMSRILTYTTYSDPLIFSKPDTFVVAEARISHATVNFTSSTRRGSGKSELELCGTRGVAEKCLAGSYDEDSPKNSQRLDDGGAQVRAVVEVVNECEG
ncbi:hypothetical protein E2C01_059205 [Portunus trituberculatus]|uniref:Uncharacterized protein n=1 Tax=Portunus trituberculatus TaxID=210409 RepID=A0A5B7H5F8_PORTR|nr:hypothetical protein [Portunus trituberculatus]